MKDIFSVIEQIKLGMNSKILTKELQGGKKEREREGRQL